MSSLFKDDNDRAFGFFLWGGVLMLPNVIIQMIPGIKRKHSAPYLAFIFSCCMNMGYGCLIQYFFTCYHDQLYAAVALLAVPILMTAIPCTICCCAESFEGNLSATREVFSRALDERQFCEVLQMNRALFPHVVVNAEAYHYHTHYETRQVKDSNGHTHTETREVQEKVVTWRGSQSFHYKTWQEDGNSIRLSNDEILHCVCKTNYRLTEKGAKKLRKLRQQMLWLAYCYDSHANVTTSFSLPGYKPSSVGVLSKETPKVMKFYQSIGGRALWCLFFILGYQSAYEAFWSMSGNRMVLRLVKLMGKKSDNLRCKYWERDEYAAMTTFRKDEQPILDQNEEIAPSQQAMDGPLIQDPYYYYYNPYPYADLNGGYAMPPMPSDMKLPEAMPSAPQGGYPT